MEVSFLPLAVRSLKHFFSRVEYRALEGFVLQVAVSPFNFTAIGGNLPGSTSSFFSSLVLLERYGLTRSCSCS